MEAGLLAGFGMKHVLEVSHGFNVADSPCTTTEILPGHTGKKFIEQIFSEKEPVTTDEVLEFLTATKESINRGAD